MVRSDIEEILRTIIPLNSGGSFDLMDDMLFNIARLKYVRQKQLVLINKRYNKFCALKKLNYLAEHKLLKKTYQDVFTVTKKTIDYLKVKYQVKFRDEHPVELLPSVSKGLGDINQLHNTEIFIQALKLPLFKALLYPSFELGDTSIIPDALLVLADKDRYKLTFLEVEASKSNWTNYIENKRTKYIELARDKSVYNYWLSVCNILKLTPPDINSFSFSVSVVGKYKGDSGEGFNFMDKLNG